MRKIKTRKEFKGGPIWKEAVQRRDLRAIE